MNTDPNSPKKEQLKAKARFVRKNIGRLLGAEDDPHRLQLLLDAYWEAKDIEQELDLMQEEIDTHHIRHSEFWGDLMGRPADDFDDDDNDNEEEDDQIDDT